MVRRRAGDAVQHLVVGDAARPGRGDARRAARTSWCAAPSTVVGWAMIAGVQSTVWILAISAAFTSRALSYSSWSDISGYSRVQPLADGVVLAHEERVQDARGRPRSCRPRPTGRCTSGGLGRQAQVVDAEPAHARCDRRASAKSSLPPYICDPSHQWVSPVTYVGGPPGSGLGSGCVRRIFIGCSGHGSSCSSWISQGCRAAPAVAQPVVHLELDPGPGQQVERGRGLEALAREEPPADQPRVRVEQPLRLVRVGVLQRHVPPEPAPERAHERVVEVVVGAVEHPRTQVAADVGILEGRLVERPAARVVEVLVAQPVAQPDQDGDRGDRRQPRPAERPVDLLGRVGDKLRELPRHPVPFPRIAGRSRPRPRPRRDETPWYRQCQVAPPDNGRPRRGGIDLVRARPRGAFEL